MIENMMLKVCYHTKKRIELSLNQLLSANNWEEPQLSTNEIVGEKAVKNWKARSEVLSAYPWIFS